MFNSVYHEEFERHHEFRSAILGKSSQSHELCYLKRFDQYLADNLCEEGHISEMLIDKWLSSLRGTTRTKVYEIQKIRQFLIFLNMSGHCASLPTIPKIHDDYAPYIFSDDELKLIFDSADNIVVDEKKSCKYLPIEFPVILRLLFSCGLRIGETLQIHMKDIDLENGVLKLINTKGDKHRFVPMSAKMTEILSGYCLSMGLIGNDEAWLFPGNDVYSHISDRTIKHRFEKILKNNAIQLKNRRKQERGPCLHCLRHVFAFQSFKQAEKLGISITDSVPFLSIYLGHDSLNETEKYLKFSSELYPESTETFGSFMNDLLPEVDYES